MTNKKSALVVDDSAVMRKLIGDALSSDGFEVVAEASDGRQAFESYRNVKPDLVTMDIVMPREHGIDALRRIIEFDPDARVVLVSGLHQKELLMEALQAGARDYVIKPFAAEDLLLAAKKSAR